ncbi:MAG: hypothetical protein K6D03_04995 [Solobacterium sp.]|nr:hypothetical protein [Solobacterium sp.]
MKKNVFDVVLLNALPASGKSEVRKFMNENDPEQMVNDFHIGKNLQLDDFPYVWLMRQLDKKLAEMGQPTLYYPDDESPTYDGRVWGVLSILLSEDYQDLVNRNYVSPANAAEYLFERFDRASVAAGMKPLISLLDEDIRNKIAADLEPEARALLDEKQSQYAEDLSDKTIIIEFSRGGNDGAAMPLTGTFGYQYTYSMLSPDLLKNAAVLYIWVTPEDSRAKNDARFDPNNPGSSINHKTPDKVMMYDYGCDDILYLKEVSEVPGTLTVEAWGQKFHLPVGVFDNREDLTTQFRGPKETWDEASRQKAVKLVSEATAEMWAHYKK